MKHRLISATATLALLAGSALAEDVRVYNWSDYIDEALLTKFTADTGLNLIYDVFDSNELLETKMLAGGSGYDVVVPSGTFLQRQISALLLDLLPACNPGELEMGAFSCEHVANLLYENADRLGGTPSVVEVWEDDENGVRVWP